MKEQTREILPGLYGLIGPVSNVYLLDDGPAGVTVIDAGMPSSQGKVLGLLHDLGCEPQAVKQILVTHADVDHVGGLAALLQATGALVIASAESEEYLRKRRNPPHLPGRVALPSALINLVFRRAVTVNQVVKDGDMLPIAGGIRVLATPGHTAGHLSFYWERERVLFAGDLLNNTSGLSLTPARITWNIPEAQQSARRVLALNPAWIAAGHGPVWSAAAHPDAVEKLLASFSGA